MTENEIGTQVVDAALGIHRALGPGLLETVYEIVLAGDLRRRGFTVEQQVPIPISYNGIHFTQGFRADLLVGGNVIIELKSTEHLHNSHKKQLLTYLRLSGKKLGYVLNFGVPMFKDGISRTVNELAG